VPFSILVLNVSCKHFLDAFRINSPVAEVPFKHNVKDAFSGRYQAHITLTNPNSESIDYVAFKVKTNAPERYHVKPSAGKVAPGKCVASLFVFVVYLCSDFTAACILVNQD